MNHRETQRTARLGGTAPRRLPPRAWVLVGLTLVLVRAAMAQAPAEKPLVPGDVANFAYEVRSDCFTEAPLEPVGDTRRVSVCFPTPVPSGVPENDTVVCVLHLPKGTGPWPGVVVLHELGTSDGALVKEIALRLTGQGYAALTLTLPYHMTRKPAGRSSAELMMGADTTQVVKAFRQAIVDIRRSVDWLAQRPDIDRDHLGVMGVSLGGIVTLLASRVEPRFKAAASIIGSGDLASVVWDGMLTKLVRQSLEAHGVTKDSLTQTMAPVESMNYAQCNPSLRLLMICARLDLVIPPACATRTWEAFGKPPIVWFLAGHYDIFLQREKVYQEVFAFFAPALKKA